MLTKIVNGQEVECSPEEETAIRAEWAANDPAKLPQPKPILSDGDLATLLVAKGVLSQADVDAAAQPSGVSAIDPAPLP